MKRLFRFWMTGGFAVVVAALGGGGRSALAARAAGFDDAPEVQASRYDVDETMRRLERAAARHGLAVFARVVPPPALHGGAAGSTALVFEASRGGTPVLMYAGEAQPELPLSVHVRATAAGLAEVWIGRVAGDGVFEGLPDDVARDLTELPGLVNDALT